MPLEGFFSDELLTEAAAVVQQFSKLGSDGVDTDSGDGDDFTIFAVVAGVLEGIEVTTSYSVSVANTVSYNIRLDITIKRNHRLRKTGDVGGCLDYKGRRDLNNSAS